MGKYNIKHRIGKPQKSNKHKKLKAVDSSYAAEWGVRVSKKQEPLKINSKPKNINDQEVPMSAQRLLTKFPQRKRIRNRGPKEEFPDVEHLKKEKGMTRPVEPAPVFQQKSGESEFSYMKRIDNQCKHVLAETQFKEKYGLETLVDEDGTKTEKVISKKKEKRKEKAKERKELIKTRKAEKKLDKMNDFSQLSDVIKFGEVANEPPTFTVKPRKSNNSTPLPGLKKLLLHEVIQSNSQTKSQQNSKREIGKTLKRKNLSDAEKIKMDSEQQRAIQLYRDMKVKRQKMYNLNDT